MPESFMASTLLPASPERIYTAWLDSSEHGQFTGGAAEISPVVGGAFTVWDGYIKGITLALTPFTRILQSWRADDFPEGAEDSQLEVLLEEVPGGARLTLVHSNLPDGQAEEFKQGWLDYYFTPMNAYFSDQAPPQN